ncbi:hypothetical protein BdWA1_002674 [Babesia duncani]|uniref:Uncharacterized protein n=1 Tax=Babesia duncani TaxID=323732 RepID=A0AAD9UNV3_9APIC|nr:hypothetical protein BdWA1_002674 [Babesia duncani]
MEKLLNLGLSHDYVESIGYQLETSLQVISDIREQQLAEHVAQLHASTNEELERIRDKLIEIERSIAESQLDKYLDTDSPKVPQLAHLDHRLEMAVREVKEMKRDAENTLIQLSQSNAYVDGILGRTDMLRKRVHVFKHLAEIEKANAPLSFWNKFCIFIAHTWHIFTFTIKAFALNIFMHRCLCMCRFCLVNYKRLLLIKELNLGLNWKECYHLKNSRRLSSFVLHVLIACGDIIFSFKIRAPYRILRTLCS